MGIDTHSFRLLQYATQKFGKLGNAVTLGRLTVLLGPRFSKKWLGASGGAYCEPLLKKHFGAANVDSIDNSAYEGASIVADMNEPLSSIFMEQYDAVIDFGCTEHIFDVAQSLRNVKKLCKIGGIILHAVPANGFCGHGFYQFSPELFFSLYSTANGFTDTEVFLADLCDANHWYRVPPPKDGKRINIRSDGEVYVLVVTKRVADKLAPVQQSDYEHTWAQSSGTITPPHSSGQLARLREVVYQVPVIARFLYALDNAVSPTGAKRLYRHRQLRRFRNNRAWKPL